MLSSNGTAPRRHHPPIRDHDHGWTPAPTTLTSRRVIAIGVVSPPRTATPVASSFSPSSPAHVVDVVPPQLVVRDVLDPRVVVVAVVTPSLSYRHVFPR